MVSVMVTGGTGVLGQKVVPRLLADGHEVAVLTRRRAVSLPDGVRRMVGDLAAGQGLDAAAHGADVIVHLATQPFRPARVDVSGTRALLDAVKRRGGDPHLVYASIVGVERIPWFYYRRKREVELLLDDSGLQYTIQRATQFHDLVLAAMAFAARAPAVLVPAGTSCQPVDAADVAERLASLVRSGPVNGYAPDLGGPQILDAADLARTVLAVLGRRRAVLPVRIPGPVGRGFRAGEHLAPDTPRGMRTFGAYLEGCIVRGDSGAVITLPYTGKQARVRRR